MYKECLNNELFDNATLSSQVDKLVNKLNTEHSVLKQLESALEEVFNCNHCECSTSYVVIDVNQVCSV